MSHSDPGEILAESFIVGADLVEFHRHDLPIYLTPESHWAEAGLDHSAHGAPLDRLFGEPGEVFIDGVPMSANVPPVGDDVLVVLNTLSDGLTLPVVGEPASSPDIAALYDFNDGSAGIVHVPDGWEWEQASATWSFDHHA